MNQSVKALKYILQNMTTESFVTAWSFVSAFFNIKVKLRNLRSKYRWVHKISKCWLVSRWEAILEYNVYFQFEDKDWLKPINGSVTKFCYREARGRIWQISESNPITDNRFTLVLQFNTNSVIFQVYIFSQKNKNIKNNDKRKLLIHRSASAGSWNTNIEYITSEYIDIQKQ